MDRRDFIKKAVITTAATLYKAGGLSSPYAHFRIRLNETSRIEAIEHCNLHGTWIGEPVDIRVV